MNVIRKETCSFRAALGKFRERGDGKYLDADNGTVIRLAWLWFERYSAVRFRCDLHFP
jgi:hypothetical protein